MWQLKLVHYPAPDLVGQIDNRRCLRWVDQIVTPGVKRLGKRAILKLFHDADHSFHVPAKTGRRDAEVRADMLDELAAWLERVV